MQVLRFTPHDTWKICGSGRRIGSEAGSGYRVSGARLRRAFQAMDGRGCGSRNLEVLTLRGYCSSRYLLMS